MSSASPRIFLVGPVLKDGAELRALLARAGWSAGEPVIAVDRGLELCVKAQVPVSQAIGDWDSLDDPALLARVTYQTLPRDKDRSDYAFALDLAWSTLKPGSPGVQMIALGFLGGRMDHHYAVLADSAAFADQKADGLDRISLLGSEGDVHCFSSHGTKKTLRLQLSQGQLLSIFAVGGPCQGVSLLGLRYGLDDAACFPSSQGLSNVVNSKGDCLIEVRSGTLLVIIPYGPEH